MATIKIICENCDKKADQEVGHVNRAKRQGNHLYCGRPCSSEAKRKTKAEKIEAKRIYDIAWRARPEHKAERSAEFKRNYNPEKARIKRAFVKKAHPEIEAKRREYMALPEYKAHKKEYDKEFRAKKKYGDYWECAILAIEINSEVKSRSSDIEIRRQNGTLNKHKARKREYEKFNSTKLKGSPLGNLERY